MTARTAILVSLLMSSLSAFGAPPEQYLEYALQAERFIAKHEFAVEDGIAWKTSPESDATEPNYTFYHGSGGIALFYVELHRATGEDRYLDKAKSAGHALVAAQRKRDEGTISINSGFSADAFVLHELYKATGEERFQESAREAIAKLKASAVPLGNGVGWIEQNPFAAYNPANVNVGEMYDLTIGSAGVGVFFLYAHREGLDPEGQEWAAKIAERLLEVAEVTPDGLSWPMMDNLPARYIMPNFSHGPAGIGYFFADLYRDVRDDRYLKAAIDSARYVQSRAVTKGDGLLVTHHEAPDPADLYYLSTCHGPAGTGRLMYLLNELTGDSAWAEWNIRNIRGALAIGAPEQRSPGLWNNVGQCCGDTGLGEYALYTYAATGDEIYQDLAKRIAAQLVKMANADNDALSWTTAEMRIRPDWTHTQTGYMQGAAGMGSYFLHLATREQGSVKIDLLATPFD